MDKNYYILLLFLCWSLPFVGQAQSENLQNQSPGFFTEHVVFHTDRPLYVSGETIWFKMYVFVSQQNRLSNFSKVGYMELISQEGVVISRVKIGLEKGRGVGAIKLPKELNNGSYTLRAYTQGLRNSGAKSFARNSLIILNPNQPIVRADEEKAEAYEAFEPGGTFISVASENQLQVEIKTSESEFSQRQLATLEITTSDPAGRPVAADLSLSVTLPSPEFKHKRELFPQMNDNKTNSFPISPMTIHFPAEREGMYLRGKVINKTTNRGEPSVDVYLAFPGKTASVYSVKTDQAGQFSFLLPKLFGLKEIILQARPKNPIPIAIELSEEFHETKPTESIPFVLPPAWAPLANATMVNAQIRQAYQAFELPPVYHTQQSFGDFPFFGKPDAQYYLDDYTRFPLPEFFYEVVPEVRVRGKFGAEELKLLNEWETTSEETPPLLLVDGVPVFDQRTFLKINNKLIASTEVVRDPFWLNPGIFDGIIQISSFEGDARCFVLPETALRTSFLTFLPQQEFVMPDYGSKPDSRLPDFRNTLYWNPSIQTNAEGKARIQFYTSDAIGEYAVRVEGVSDTGLLGTGSSMIEVRKIEK